MSRTAQLVLRCTPEEKALWESVAEESQRKVSDWARLMLNSAATVQMVEGHRLESVEQLQRELEKADYPANLTGISAAATFPFNPGKQSFTPDPKPVSTKKKKF
jgi:hypothetical protein